MKLQNTDVQKYSIMKSMVIKIKNKNMIFLNRKKTIDKDLLIMLMLKKKLPIPLGWKSPWGPRVARGHVSTPHLQGKTGKTST
uniref:Uncharacterized protein n=1 Tax=Anguilla anguilla TaxID=7936 RepID=A0A0E9WQM9_ANGAN